MSKDTRPKVSVRLSQQEFDDFRVALIRCNLTAQDVLRARVQEFLAVYNGRGAQVVKELESQVNPPASEESQH